MTTFPPSPEMSDEVRHALTRIPLPLKQSEVDLPPTLPITAPTPHELLSRAVLSGAGIEVVERLAVLVERFDDRQLRKAFENAMADARAEGIPLIAKSQKVDFTTARGRTSYVYESFGDVASVADKVFPKHGITYRFRTTQEGDKITVTCIVAHRDGYWEENSLSGLADISGNKNSIQAVGSTVTYLERYTLKAALGLAASADDDGQAAGRPAPERISQEQFEELTLRIDKVKADPKKFCEMFGISIVRDLAAADYGVAMGKLAAFEQQRKTKHGSAGDRRLEEGEIGEANSEPLP